MSKLTLWQEFCEQHQILEQGVPLFQMEGDRVVTIPYGKDRRLVLKRNEQMEALVVQEVNKVIRDFENGTGYFDGLIYMMYQVRQGVVVPMYIGKSEKFGTSGGNLSSNIKNIEKNSNFCRWGYNYAYHIGNLSAVVCPGHDNSRRPPVNENWAKALFEKYPSSSPVLKQPIYFWIKAWSHEWVGVWKEFGATSVTFLEYLLIGLASDIFGEVVLNKHGVNRK